MFTAAMFTHTQPVEGQYWGHVQGGVGAHRTGICLGPQPLVTHELCPGQALVSAPDLARWPLCNRF
jgi:hypothetical protein